MRGIKLSTIVLKREPYKEADEILTCWSWELGKVRLRAPGVRRAESRLKTVLLPLSWLQFDVVPSPYLAIITGVRPIVFYLEAGRELGRAALVFAIFEMVLRSVPEHQPVPAVSGLLRRSLEHLSRSTPISEQFLLVFRYRLLAALGFEPTFDRCSLCSQSLEASTAVHWHLGHMGALCDSCGRRLGKTQVLSRLGLAWLVALRRSEEVFPRLSMDQQAQAKLDAWLKELFLTAIERPINSLVFLTDHA